MRIIVCGDRLWSCHKLAAGVLQRLVARYGPDLVIVHGGGTGVEESFDAACKGLGIATEAHPVSDREWQMQGERAVSVRNQWMVDLGAQMCLAVHRYLANSKGTRDMVRQAIEAEVPVWLIESEADRPVRVRSGDARVG